MTNEINYVVLMLKYSPKLPGTSPRIPFINHLGKATVCSKTFTMLAHCLPKENANSALIKSKSVG